MKRTLVLFALALLLTGCGGEIEDYGAVTTGGGESTNSSTTASGTTAELRTVTIDASGGEKVKVQVEIADNAQEQAQGLMDRERLGEDRGMLFVFPSEEVRSFWMKNTLLPLSIAYIDAEGRIIDLQEMKPLDDEPPHYVSAEPARYALEVNKGFFDEHGVKVGDRTELPD